MSGCFFPPFGEVEPLCVELRRNASSRFRANACWLNISGALVADFEHLYDRQVSHLRMGLHVDEPLDEQLIQECPAQKDLVLSCLPRLVLFSPFELSKDRLDPRHFEQLVAPPRRIARLQSGLLGVPGQNEIGAEVDLCCGDRGTRLSAATTKIRI